MKLSRQEKQKQVLGFYTVVFAKMCLDSFNRYKCGSKHLVVAEEESEDCPGKNMQLLSSDFSFAFNLSIFTFLSY